jgi:RNA polymerase sigma-70 factor (ECF subfamily)
MNVGVSIDKFECLYRAHFHRYLRVAEAITGDVEGARDAVQEGFARAIRYRRAFRGEASLATWVWRCVVNVAKATRRTDRSTLAARGEDGPVHDDAMSMIVRESIATLPERQRLAIYLRYHADMDYQTIADVLGVEIGTVGATLNKAHATLRRQLQEVRHGEL